MEGELTAPTLTGGFTSTLTGGFAGGFTSTLTGGFAGGFTSTFACCFTCTFACGTATAANPIGQKSVHCELCLVEKLM
jgi:hypothetical protein